MNKNEQEIIQQLKSGVKEVYSDLFKSYYAGLSAFAFKYLKDIDTSRELVQDLFVTIYEKRETLDIRGSVKAYLFQSVNNRCLNHIEKRKTRVKHHKIINQQYTNVADLNDQIIELEMEEEIFKCIDKLAPRCKDIFFMSRIKGLGNSQIAEELNISVRTVETQISNALKELRNQLKHYLD